MWMPWRPTSGNFWSRRRPHPDRADMSVPPAAVLTTTDQLFRPARDNEFFPWRDELPPRRCLPLTCAELSRLAYASLETIGSTLEAIGWRLEETLHGARFLPGQSDTDGFITQPREGGPRCIVFRGTDSGSVDDLLTDLNALPRSWDHGLVVHRGFADEYDSLRRPLQRLGPHPAGTILTGHSLGGALANLALHDLPGSRLLTWGAPRVGDPDFARSLPASTIERYVHACDLVPRVPLESLSRESLTSFLRRFADGLQDESDLAPRLWNLVEKLDPSAFLQWQAGKLLGRPLTEYRHAGPTIYLSCGGTMQVDPAESYLRSDQRFARDAYRRALADRFPASQLFDDFWQSLKQLGLSLPGRDLTDLRRELIDLVRSLAETNPLRIVLLRDFADHAPCHYVRALWNQAREEAQRTPRES